ncbi:MAG TPA: M3 family metallopeptidase [Chitinophagales bacterium]|nr:M3 family metallopeptidase [Chitinophagales bacterium]
MLNKPLFASDKIIQNPFITKLNEPVDYGKVTATDVEKYANYVLMEVKAGFSAINNQSSETFDNLFGAVEELNTKIAVAYNNCHMLYWVSPDSLIREKSLLGFQLLDSISTVIYSDKNIYKKMLRFKSSDLYKELKGYKKNLADEMMLNFEQTGVNLKDDKLEIFKKLNQEINQLSSQYSENMNSTSDVLTLDENGTKGLPEAFKQNYKVADNKYEIPIINATNESVMSNASNESTRKAYYLKFVNRAADKNLIILDSLVKKRDELAKLMGYPTYAAFNLVPKMAKDPKTVWKFINDLVSLSKGKAKADIKQLLIEKKKDFKDEKKITLNTWDIPYYKNQILKNQYQVNKEELRAFQPMEQCLKGMFDIYQQLLGLEFRKVNNPSVWHEEVELYEVYEGDKLKGRFYLDLFPRPNKETWFYGVPLTMGKATPQGYEVPVSMLLGNFTRPTKTQPSLLSQRELNTLFHEFGHIVNQMAYHGEYSSQANSKADFVESMSQLFENWLWDYDILSSFAKNYKTGEVLPKATFDKMKKAKNLSSGLSLISSLRNCIYDMNLYDKYNPAKPVSTDKLWQKIDKQLGVMKYYVPGTHPQAAWIHINTHPVYMYGYLWSNVFAQDMFTLFEKNGLRDTKTGIRYRELILANGTQRDILQAVEEFLGRPSDNKAYIKSLGLE